jgi:hypothetical protein
MSNRINGLPGYPTGQAWVSRKIRRGNQPPVYLDGGAVIDGTNSGDASNTGYPQVLQPGKIMVKAASGGLYQNFIIGKSNGALAGSSDTSITVVAAVATEVARLIAAAGTSLSLAIIGPPTAAGTVAATNITVTAASGTTLTISSLSVAKVTDSLIALRTTGYTAGSFCLIDDDDYVQLADETNARANQPFPRMLIGATLKTSQLLDWPADASTVTYLKGLLNVAGGLGQFRFDDVA